MYNSTMSLNSDDKENSDGEQEKQPVCKADPRLNVQCTLRPR